MTDEHRRVRSAGKQVLLDDRHLADAISEDAAAAIADALEYIGRSFDKVPQSAHINLNKVLL
jgi:hypothetical protein